MLNVDVKRIKKVNKGKLKAFVDVIVNDVLVLKGLRVIKADNGLFVGMPSTKGTNGKYYDDFYISDKEERENLNKVVITKYKEE